MTSLVIAEKPSVASDIAAALGGFSKGDGYWQRDDLIVTSAVGHLVEIACSEAASRPRGFAGLPVIPEQFELEVIKGREDRFSAIEKLLHRRDVDMVINACDAGREGELIFRLIMEKAGCRLPTRRMWMQSMTKDSICEAFAGAIPGEEKDNLYYAARCRSESDWLVGINGSRAVSTIFQTMSGSFENSSTGRVQTPTLAILVDHENLIDNFVPQDFWEIHGTFGCAAGSYSGRWKGVAPAAGDGESEEDAETSASRFFDKAAAVEVLQRVQNQPVDRVEQQTEPTSKAPPYLFDLTSLQREANKLFKLPAKKTLEIAQSLYERHKVTTYPRTDSNRLPEDYLETVGTIMHDLEGSPWGKFVKMVTDSGWIVPNKRIFDNSKITDHFAIIPTGTLSDRLDENEKRIYELIVRRFIAAFFPKAEFDSTKRITYVAGEEFHSSGTVMVAAGWMAVLGAFDDDGKPIGRGNKELCLIADGETPQVAGIEMKQGQTKPPSRYTEAKLLAAMETAGKLVEDEDLRAAMKDRGLGTPATRAETIETLKDDGRNRKPPKPKEPYVRLEGNFLVPTAKGKKLISFLRENGAEFLTSAQTTGEWEACLKAIERGEFSPDDFMNGIRQTTSDLVAVLQEESKRLPGAQLTPIGAPCPKCGQGILANAAGFECEAQCGFTLRRTIAARQMKNEEIAQLFKEGRTATLSGFHSAAKKRDFSAALRMEDGEVKFEFAEQEVSTLSCSCPKCGGKMASKPALVVCVDCEFKVWREVFKKALTDAELVKLLTTGKIDLVKGFKSKAGKKFDAGVKLDLAEGRVNLEFKDK